MEPMPQQRNLVLILARDLADKLASAAFVVDGEGTLVYFNERCGELLGRTFAEVGPMRVDAWSRNFLPTDFDGRPLEPGQLPLVMALEEGTPAHRALRITQPGGETRDIAVTAIPLFARPDEPVGALALFWEQREA
jgi:PAS domain-containing protein